MTKEKGLKPPTLTSRLLANVFNKEMIETLFALYDPKKEPQVYNEECINTIKNKLVDYLALHDPDIRNKIKIDELNPMLEEIVNTAIKVQKLQPLFEQTIGKGTASQEDVQGIKNQYYNTFLDIGGSLSPKDREAFLGSIDKIVVNIDSAIKSKQHDGAEPTVTTHTTSKKVPPPPQHKGSHTGTLGTKPNPAHAGQRDPGAKHTDLAAKGSSAKTQR